MCTYKVIHISVEQNYQFNFGRVLGLHEISENAKECQSDGTENHGSRCRSQGQMRPDPCFFAVSGNSWLILDPAFN